MMGVMSSTLSPAVAAPGWAHIYFFGHILLFSEAFGGSRFPQGGTISQLKFILFLLCHGDTQRELVNTPRTHHVIHLFFVEWHPLSYGDLVNFYIILGD